MRKIICLLFILSNVVTYAEYNLMSGIKDFNPNSYFDNFTSNPNETSINADNIKSKSLSQAYSDSMANDLRSNFDKRAEYTFAEDELSKSSKIVKNSNDIVQGITNTYTDCKTVKKCEQVLSKEVKECETPLEAKTYKCERERVVDVVIPDKISKRIRVDLTVHSKSGGTFRYSLATKSVTSSTGGTINVSQTDSIDGIGCENFSYQLIENGYAPNTFTHRVLKSVAIDNTCKDPSLNIVIDQDHKDNNKWKMRGIYAIVDISSQKQPVITDNLKGECLELDKRVEKGICKTDNDVCVDGDSTKIINGVPVTRECWRYKAVYKCNNNPSLNTCSQYEANKCIQVASQCKQYDDGICLLQTKSYQCSIQSCSDDTNIICGGNTKIQCLDGSCVEKSSTGDSGFADSISKLAVISEALKGKPENFTEDSSFIFSGKVMSCRKTGYGFSDCCKDSGWGIDLNLAHCSSEEKELGEMKEKNLVIYVGKNVHKTSEFEPQRVDKRYCVFASKIARILQEQGRFGQLGINFGTPKYPDCSGLSPKQFAQINMGKIDLSEISEDIASKHQSYDQNELGKKLTGKIQQYYTKERGNNA